MAEVGSAFVTVVPSAKGFGRKLDSQVGGDLDRSGSSGGKRFGTAFGGSLKGLVGPAIAIFGTALIGGFLKDGIGQASDLNETLSKSKVIFGSRAKDIEKFGDTAAKSLGLSKSAAIDFATSFGDMFSQIGFTSSQAAKMSKDVVQVSADLGSFNNLETADVNDRIAAAFRGEYDSLQAVIPNINAARVEHEALAKTGKKTAKELTAQEKAAAVLAIIHKDGAKAAGDFERTSGGLANQQKILTAQTDDLKAKMGKALVPVLADVARFINEKVFPAIGDLGDLFRKAKGYVQPGIDAFKSFSQGSGDAAGKFQQVRDTISSVWESVKGIFTNGVSIVLSLWHAFGGNIVQFLSATFTNTLMILRGAFKVIQGIFQVVSALLRGDWQGVWDGIKNIVSGALGIIVGFIRQGFALIRYIFKNVGVILSAVFTEAWGLAKRATSAGISALIGLLRSTPGRAVGALSNLGSKLFSFASTAFGQLRAAAVAGVNSAVQFIKGVPKRISNGLGSLGGLLFDAGKAVIQGLINGIKSMIGAAVSAAKGAANAVKDGAKGALGVKSPSRVFHEIGINTMKGLENGIDAQAPKAANAAVSAANSLTRSSSLPAAARLSGANSSRPSSARDRGLTRHDLESLLHGLNLTVNGQPARLQIAGA